MEKQFRVKLIVRRVNALASVNWLKDSWVIFWQAPIAWILMFLTIAVVALAGQMHPILGLLSLLAGPFLTAGIYSSVVLLQKKRPLVFANLFVVFKQKDNWPTFFRLVMLELAMLMPLTIMLSEIIVSHQENQLNQWLVLAFVISVVITRMLLAYTVAIAYFLKERRLLAIVQTSFIACWRNIIPLMVFGLLSIGLIMLSIPTMFLGLVLVMPILHIAFFHSFNDFFALQVNPTDDAILEV